ncbi:hypothetical protein HWV62_36412 [Athelia sp. TMB]|nr:hypothetical protein HWV62_36412 [Athelia sp. TMB]
MSLKAELETWASALKAYDEEDLERALDLFAGIADSSKILTNIGLIHATLGEHEAAVEQFNAATQLDQYLAVAYFQCGVSNFLLGRYELALKDFEEALLYLRGNQAMYVDHNSQSRRSLTSSLSNYEQLGLKFKLYSAEVLFNKGLSLIYMGNLQGGITDLQDASREKATSEHSVIDEAILAQGDGYTVFSIPVGVLYRPNERKIKNAKARDYMGKARLVAASDASDAFTGFTGSTRLKMGITPTNTFAQPDGMGGGLARANTTLPQRAPIMDESPVSGLARSKTTLAVSSTSRDPPAPPMADQPARGPGIGRSTSLASRTPGPGGPVRGLSVRKPAAPAPAPAAPADSRLTEFYDDYIDSYGDREQPPLPPIPTQAQAAAKMDKISAWAREASPPRLQSQPSIKRTPPPSSYTPSSYGSNGMRRKLTRRGTARRMNTNTPSMYEEEEEGYASGSEEAGFELVKIRVKLHYQGDVRGMALTPEMPFEEFLERVTAKFDKPINGLGMQFRDEDGGRVTLKDDSDYEMAIETVREQANGKPEGKLEVWLVDSI